MSRKRSLMNSEISSVTSVAVPACIPLTAEEDGDVWLADMIDQSQNYLLDPLPLTLESPVISEMDPLAVLSSPPPENFRFQGKKIHLTYPTHLPMELLRNFMESFSPMKWYVIVLGI